MAHMLARLKGVKPEVIKSVLKADASQHAEQGLRLEHLWQNVDDLNEVLFLFKSEDINKAKRFIERVHGEAMKGNPNANLPHMTFLEEK